MLNRRKTNQVYDIENNSSCAMVILILMFVDAECDKESVNLEDAEVNDVFDGNFEEQWFTMQVSLVLGIHTFTFCINSAISVTEIDHRIPDFLNSH